LYDRWHHCDPCENLLDKPLVYERGWGKKLSLVVAANSHQVCDVTMRYSRDDLEGFRNRRLRMFKDDWLSDLIKSFNNKAQARMSQQLKQQTQEMMLKEAEELKSFHQNQKPSGSDETYNGRTSGSLEWRSDRGEVGHSQAKQEGLLQNVEGMTPNRNELSERRFRVEYFPAEDLYNRPIGKEKEYCWESYVCKARNMMRKEELDWKMVYLCRNEKSQRGYITWTINLPSRYLITSVMVAVKSKTYEQGVANWLLTSEKLCDKILPGNKNYFESRYEGCKTISLKAILFNQGGNNSTHSWQHSQLFRSKLDENGEAALVIDVSFKKI